MTAVALEEEDRPLTPEEREAELQVRRLYDVSQSRPVSDRPASHFPAAPIVPGCMRETKSPSNEPIPYFVNEKDIEEMMHRTRGTREVVTTSFVEETPKQGLAGDAATRKASPIASGVLFYFTNALAAIAHLSKVGNDQHNPGEPMHWAFDKSQDHADCILRHLSESGKEDTDGVLHDVKVAWRALANLETVLLKKYPELKPGKNVKGFTR